MSFYSMFERENNFGKWTEYLYYFFLMEFEVPVYERGSFKKFFDKFHNNNHSSYIFLFRNVVLNLVYVGLKVFPQKAMKCSFLLHVK